MTTEAGRGTLRQGPVMTRYYKVTDEDGSAMHGGSGKWTRGRWRSVRGPLVACERGLHLCTIDRLPAWLGPVIWEAEVDGELIADRGKLVARRARVIRRLDTWNERTARLFAADCAEHVLPLFEKAYPNDSRPRDALAVVRRYANGEATKQELATAGAAAGDAAGDAARAAAWDAADAARAAARGAARYATGASARDAAWAAAWAAAGDTAGVAARGAARYAAWAAAWAATGDGEVKWQSERLAYYLGGEK